MKITLVRVSEPFHFEAFGENGKSVHIDAATSLGGTESGVRPMEMLLQALAGCASIDIISILRKQRQEISGFSAEVEGERESGKDANLFRRIKVAFHVSGNVDENHLKRAIALSMEKYCSVAKTLEKTAEITWSYILNGC